MFNLFRNRMNIEQQCVLKQESEFIYNGSSATSIFHMRLGMERPAAMVLTEKEGPDSTFVYTFKAVEHEQELNKGDYFSWKQEVYFVYEDINMVIPTNYKKQMAYKCNVSVESGSDQCSYGYYLSSLRKYLDTEFAKNLVITTKEQPLLILPYQDWVQVGAYILVQKQPYKIVDFDVLSNADIAYCSIKPDFTHQLQDVPVAQPPHTDVAKYVLKAGEVISLPVNYGFMQTSTPVDIITKTKDIISFKIPFGLKEIVITTKDIDKHNISTKYKVV